MIVRVTAPGVVGAYRYLATQPVAVLAVDVAVHVVVHGLPPQQASLRQRAIAVAGKSGLLDFLKSSANLSQIDLAPNHPLSKKVARL